MDGIQCTIWGYVYNDAVHDLTEASANFSLNGFAEPRIEPEIVFGLAAAPTEGMDEHALLSCIDWIAHGFEIVQSIPQMEICSRQYSRSLWPAWGVANRATPYGCFALRSWIGPLSTFEINLYRSGVLTDRGHAANVLGGPVFALRHLVELLASDHINPPLADSWGLLTLNRFLLY